MRLLLIQFVAIAAIYTLGSWLIGGAGVHYPSAIVGVLCLTAVRIAREAMTR